MTTNYGIQTSTMDLSLTEKIDNAIAKGHAATSTPPQTRTFFNSNLTRTTPSVVYPNLSGDVDKANSVNTANSLTSSSNSARYEAGYRAQGSSRLHPVRAEDSSGARTRDPRKVLPMQRAAAAPKLDDPAGQRGYSNNVTGTPSGNVIRSPIPFIGKAPGNSPDLPVARKMQSYESLRDHPSTLRIKKVQGAPALGATGNDSSNRDPPTENSDPRLNASGSKQESVSNPFAGFSKAPPTGPRGLGLLMDHKKAGQMHARRVSLEKKTCSSPRLVGPDRNLNQEKNAASSGAPQQNSSSKINQKLDTNEVARSPKVPSNSNSVISRIITISGNPSTKNCDKAKSSPNPNTRRDATVPGYNVHSTSSSSGSNRNQVSSEIQGKALQSQKTLASSVKAKENNQVHASTDPNCHREKSISKTPMKLNDERGAAEEKQKSVVEDRSLTERESIPLFLSSISGEDMSAISVNDPSNSSHNYINVQRPSSSEWVANDLLRDSVVSRDGLGKDASKPNNNRVLPDGVDELRIDIENNPEATQYSPRSRSDNQRKRKRDTFEEDLGNSQSPVKRLTQGEMAIDSEATKCSFTVQRAALTSQRKEGPSSGCLLSNGTLNIVLSTSSRVWLENKKAVLNGIWADLTKVTLEKDEALNECLSLRSIVEEQKSTLDQVKIGLSRAEDKVRELNAPESRSYVKDLEKERDEALASLQKVRADAELAKQQQEKILADLSELNKTLKEERKIAEVASEHYSAIIKEKQIAIDEKEEKIRELKTWGDSLEKELDKTHAVLEDERKNNLSTDEIIQTIKTIVNRPT